MKRETVWGPWYMKSLALLFVALYTLIFMWGIALSLDIFKITYR